MDWTVIRDDGLKLHDPDMCESGECICQSCGATVYEADRYCHDCGVRLLTTEDAEAENPLLYMEYQKWEGDR